MHIIVKTILLLIVLSAIVLYFIIKNIHDITYDYHHIVPHIDLGTTYVKAPVPKVIYRSWCDSDPVGVCVGRSASLDVLNSTKDILVDWEQVIYGDKEIDEFLQKEFGSDHVVSKAYYLINSKYGAARADLFRYLVIYKYGGLYLDMKSCATGSILDMPDDMDMWVSSWNTIYKPHTHLFPKTGEYQNWYIYGRAGAPILNDIISKIVSNIYYVHTNSDPYLLYMVKSSKPTVKNLVVSVTGPVAMTIAIQKSPHKSSVYYNNSINKSLKYCCIKDVISSSHYSKQKEPLVPMNYVVKTVLESLPSNYGSVSCTNITNTDKIGVVMPIFGRPEYLEKCLDSLKSSDMSKVILVLVNETGTKNHSKKIILQVKYILDKFKEMENGVIIIEKKKHGNMYDSYKVAMDMLIRAFNITNLMTIDSDAIVKHD